MNYSQKFLKLELSILSKLRELSSNGSEHIIKLLDVYFLDNGQEKFCLITELNVIFKCNFFEVFLILYNYRMEVWIQN